MELVALQHGWRVRAWWGATATRIPVAAGLVMLGPGWNAVAIR